MERSSGQGADLRRRLEIRRVGDEIVSRSESFRRAERSATIEEKGETLEFRSDLAGVRKVSITIEGQKIRHESEDPFRGVHVSPAMPTEMKDPLILDESLITSYALALQHLLRRHGEKSVSTESDGDKHPLDRLVFQAMVPHRL